MSDQPALFKARVLSPSLVPPASAWTGAFLSGLVGLLGLLDVLPGGLAWAFCPAFLLLGLGFALPVRGRWREAEIEASPRGLRIQGAGVGLRELRPRQIRALSTAFGADGLVVAVARRGLDGAHGRPTLIQVDTVQQADAICDALAVGNRGTGALDWQFGSSTSRMRKVASWGLVVGSVLLPLAKFIGLPRQPDLFVWPVLLMMSSLGMLLASLLARESPRRVVLHETGVDLTNTRTGWGLVPYGCIDEVKRTGEGFELRLTPPHEAIAVPLPSSDVSEAEVQHLLDQIQAACLRARGLGRRARDTDNALDDLHRGRESIAQWLKRLQLQAEGLRSGAYRGESYNERDLWEALDDHDASPEVRLAAARVLSQVEPEKTRVRVAQLADEQRDDDARAAFELLLEEQDLELLAEGLERRPIWRQSGG